MKKIDAGPRGADHLGERFLADIRNDRLRLAVSPEWAINSRTRASRFSLELMRFNNRQAGRLR